MPDSQKSQDSSNAIATESNPSSLPAITLPKGGGAIRGMGEKFAANPVTGTGSMSVPIATSPGRSGFGPQLSLSYDSGAGNGPFGFGWGLSLPAISRKTDKGLPRYLDAAQSDIFILSGAEDLVPVYRQDQADTLVVDDRRRPMVHEDLRDGYLIRRYRPRIEGLFARIERWTHATTGEVHWRSISKDNITTLYGKDNNSRIFDPADPDPVHPTRIFSWLICQSYDDKGNAILYKYVTEDDLDVDLAQVNERNRVREANRYLKRIIYGNRMPNRDDQGKAVDPALLTANTWMFEVVFDYGEHEEDAPRPVEPGIWKGRPDPFSSYRAGFEVRTYRRCRRVLMFHRFAELGIEPCLVGSTEFEYADLDYLQPVTTAAELAHQGSTRFASFIHSVTHSGYVRKADGTYLRGPLPPVEFEYTKATIQDDIRDMDVDTLENLPVGLDGATYQWVDLDGEGLSGILAEQASTWFYKPSLGNGHFGALQQVTRQPSLVALSGGRQQLLDLAGDGQLDLVEFGGAAPGFYERTQHEDWEPFRTFEALPNLTWNDPNLRFVDLNGDGHADVLITEDQVFTWYSSLAEDGFDTAQYVYQPRDEEKGPCLVFADGTQSLYLADMCGDGLTDLVRIRNGDVCYWPNLGYGRFGAKVTMDNAPRFDNPDQFSHQHVRLADIDGSGANDIIYLGRDGVRLYFNQSGNRWSEPYRLRQFPPVDSLSSVMTADLLGNGTACLVWSSPLPGDARRQMRYIDLMGGQKPHLLLKSVNNLGAETRVEYASSTKFYLEDKRDGKPWITRLPFPVHVVARVEIYDHISQNRFVTRYKYHHGYFDGVEREFRGFGMVEQWDTEEFIALIDSNTLPDAANLDVASHVPPVLTKTWFHTGVYVGRDRISNYFAGLIDGHDWGEYYREPVWRDDDNEARKHLLDDTVLPPGLTLEEEQEACRALKGAMLRQEVYALDGTGTADNPYGHPYTVTEQNFTIEHLQPRFDNRHAIFFTHPREAISYHYERNPTDPRLSHVITLEVDDFGNVERAVTIGYPRRTVPPHLPEQGQAHITFTANRFANRDEQADWRWIGLPVETRTFEMVKPPRPTAGRNALYTFGEVQTLITILFPVAAIEPPSSNTIPYEQWDWRNGWDAETDPGGIAVSKLRLIEHVRTLYRSDDLTALLSLGAIGSLALPGESYKLALTPGLLAKVFKRKRSNQPSENLLPSPAPLLEGKGADQGAYVAWDGGWWIASGRLFFDTQANVSVPVLTAAQELTTARRHFYLPRKIADSFAQSTVVEYDAHDLLVTRTSDALVNTVTAVNDYRVLQPYLMSDPNGNRTQVAFDALGMVVATAVMGKAGENFGDLLDDFVANPPLANLQAFIANPQTQASGLLGKATTRILYDLHRYQRAKQPPFAATLARETHIHDLGGTATKIQISFSYSDGFGREIQKKIQAEAGDALRRQLPVALPTSDIRPGEIVRDAQGKPVLLLTTRRWVGSGRTVFNNKGNPVRQYEPFFSATHLYEPEREMTDSGVSSILFYDPAARVIATLHPNHTYEKVVFTPWEQSTYDVNDTIAANASETGDPRSDLHIKGYVAEYFKTQSVTWQTWNAQRIGNLLGSAESDAAQKAAAHANTPTVAHLDALGRPFLTIAHNRYTRNGAVVDEKYDTRVELDIEGNQRAVIDAKDRIVMRYDYDMLGSNIQQASMEAGERWTLNDVTGKPIRAWDSRLFLRRMTYDALRRPIGLYVTANGNERLAERIVYGEGQGTANNHRTRVYQLFDGAGIVTSVGYDFKGNLREGRRDLLPTYKLAVNWHQNPSANDGSYTSLTTYDALNRPLTLASPDKSVYRPTFNEANLLDKVDVNLHGALAATPFVTNIDYDAKGQRQRIVYGNGALTSYEYDPLTFRLIHLKTTRPANADTTASQLFQSATVVQDLHYTYDPVGNLTLIEDAALKTVFYNNLQVDPACRYTYDALYRLVDAKGREHVGQAAFDFALPDGNYRDHPFAGLNANSANLQALRNYTQSYEYDAAGNFTTMRHLANGSSWLQNYDYEEESLIDETSEVGKKSNRLTRTRLGNGINRTQLYTHDEHGNMISMPHLPKMVWDFEDQLQATAQQVVNGGSGETTYYVYDAGGQRVRKVTERQNGTRKQERIYLGGFEIYREFNGVGMTTTLERETLQVMDDMQRIALVETRIKPSVGQPLIRYQLGNHLGSASVELDKVGALLSYEEFTPYGTTAFQAGRSAAEVSLKRYRYTGKERDDETGFSYHGMRYYAPGLGRWISSDPIGISDGTNTYIYVQDNPLRAVDHNGTETVETVNRKPNPVKGKAKPKVKSEDGKGIFQAPKSEITKPRITQDVATGLEAPVTRTPAVSVNKTKQVVKSPHQGFLGALLTAQIMKDLDTVVESIKFQEAMTLPGPEGFGQRIPKFLPGVVRGPMSFPSANAVYAVMNDPEPRDPLSAPGADTCNELMELGTPSRARRNEHEYSGFYWDPYTDDFMPTTEKMETDHIYPEAKILELIEVFGEGSLTAWQVFAVKNYPGNFQPLPKSLNASKRDRTAEQWQKALGVDFKPSYVQSMIKLENQIGQELIDQILRFKANNALNEAKSLQLRRLPAKWQ